MNPMPLLRSTSLALLALAGALPAAPAAAQVVVGASLPLTGPRALLGRYWQNGVNQALAEINAAGGVLGKPLQVVVEDDLGDNPNGATNAVNRLMKVHKVQAMLGPNWSVAQMATQKHYCDGSIVSVTGASGVPVTAAGCKYVVRIRANDTLQGQALVTYAKQNLKLDRIGVVHVNDDYGKGGADRVVKALEAQGLKPVGVEGHNPEDKDFSAQLGRLAKAGAQMVIIWTHDQESALIVRQARQLGLPFRFAGSTAVSQPIFLKLAGDASEGVISPSDYVASNPEPLVQAFAKKYEASYKTESELYAATYYDATHMLAKAINLAGSTEPARLREAFGRVQHTGVLGSYRCEANGDCNHQVHMVEIVKGAPVVKGTVKF
jgi:branched-chain amino acid transport system substrate-binding protein